ncbi:hypothetical protein BJ875DRAFT_165682 [Amylocarpus encephaloides]|uniref:Uncharacterized protein n=1 Tax=Amylocarpus encephaloides TaxID=45428 RepID=A0A9P7YBW3_9HELO|nr:hypothetical protein BJ875DRAFT_165682 [Amylocarpus encephaloides]
MPRPLYAELIVGVVAGRVGVVDAVDWVDDANPMNLSSTSGKRLLICRLLRGDRERATMEAESDYDTSESPRDYHGL